LRSCTIFMALCVSEFWAQNCEKPTMPLKRRETELCFMAGTGRRWRSSLATDGGRMEYISLTQTTYRSWSTSV